MSKQRPRLLLIEGHEGQAEDIVAALSGICDTGRVSTPEARRQLRDGVAEFVLASADSFMPLERRLDESRTSDILRAIAGGVCLCDVSGEIVWETERFTEYNDDTRKRISHACEQAARGFRLAIEADRPMPHRRFTIPGGEDDSRWYEIVVSPVRARGAEEAPESSELKQVAAVVFDVTTTRMAQQRIDAIDRAGREMVNFNADVVRRMDMTQRLKALEDKVIRFADELLHFDHFAVRLLDLSTGRLELVMSSGLSKTAKDHELYNAPEGSGISGYVASIGRSYICPDAGADPRYIEGLDKPGSSLTVPLLIEDRVVGIFNVESQRLGAFTEDDRQLAEMFARYIAMALHMLDMLVVERCTTGEALRGTVEGELEEPLEDLRTEAEWLRGRQAADPETAEHIARILSDIEAIRKRTRNVTSGPQTLLGADKALLESRRDPLLEHRRVLIADNEAQIRTTIADVLTRRGCEVEVFENGASAIQRLDDLLATTPGGSGVSTHFDIVVSDIKMDDRNGYEVFSAAKRLNPDLPVVLMTGFGYDPHHSIVRASQEGLQCVLFKPFQIERLLEELRKAVAPKETSTS
jgi:CheY-like chemotaxis protein